ncbi:MAG TPA: sensor domain-containing diguanylate cyclase [Terriglobales bacterium]|nr:sensor domain-containing diguanylate cyclase [Terriglobales bacterium]
MVQQKSEPSAVPPQNSLLDLCADLPQQTILNRWQDVNTVLRIGMMSGLQMQLGATLNLLCDSCYTIAPFRTGLAYFWDAKSERSSLRMVCDRGDGDLPIDQARLKERLHDANLLDLWCRIYRQPVRIRRGESPQVDAILADTGGQAALALPLFVNGRVMGSLQLFAGHADAFTDDDAQLLWVLVHVAENLLTREHANESLMMFAFTDHLTGLRTRGYFEQQLELEIKRSERKEEQFALLMLDIDKFKCLNDTYGHSIGDQVLREMAAVLTQDMREVDTVARYGGEEFVIILPETTPEEGMRVAERIRSAVEKTTFLSGPGPLEVTAVGIAPLALTISIGVSNFPADTRDKRELAEFSDAALYAAKAKGRNLVVPYAGMATRSTELPSAASPQTSTQTPIKAGPKAAPSRREAQPHPSRKEAV